MTFDFKLTPNSTGGVFQSTYQAIHVEERVPTIPLPDSHPFHNLWKEHLATLTSAVLYDTVIDAFVALASGTAVWKKDLSKDVVSAKLGEMRTLLRQTPPNVVVVSGVAGEDYGFHIRGTSLWPFICISEEYIDMWVVANEHSLKKLGLAAVLKTTLDHEIGEWIFTLKFGCGEDFPAAQILGGDEVVVAPEILHQEIQEHGPKYTAKVFKAIWEPRSEEPGNFVEVRSRGGIMTYVNKAVLQTGEKRKDNHVLPISYLKIYDSENNSSVGNSLLFRPGPKKGQRKEHAGKEHVVKKRPAKTRKAVLESDEVGGDDSTPTICEQRQLAAETTRALLQKYRNECRFSRDYLELV